MSEDPQKWLFPPGGSASPPLAQSGNFGPVYPNDTVVMEWSPSTLTPNISLSCFNSSYKYDSDVSANMIVKEKEAPVAYTFNRRFTSTGETIYCHFSFDNTNNGNTVVWKFVKGQGALATSFSLGLASTSSTPVPSSTSTTSQESTSTSDMLAESANSSSISTVAVAGISIGATAFVLLVIFTSLLLFRHKRRKLMIPRPSIPSSVTVGCETSVHAQPDVRCSVFGSNDISELEHPFRGPAERLGNLRDGTISELGTGTCPNSGISNYKYRPS